MQCPSCGRMMVNMITFLKCSNGYCDYEEDVEPQQTWAAPAHELPAGIVYKMSAA
jgi:hypothetical protein